MNAHELDPTEPAHVDITPEQIERIPSQSVSSPLSSLITLTTPGVSADSNGSFHPLGDHAEASFVIDGQPITDQQSRTFSTQISLNALQSIEVREGAPRADVGDKTSMVIVAQTRSGLDQRRPSGSFRSLAAPLRPPKEAATWRSEQRSSEVSLPSMESNSGRFLDAPETELFSMRTETLRMSSSAWISGPHARTTLQLNTSLSRSWFQTPNTLDQKPSGRTSARRSTASMLRLAFCILSTVVALSQTNLWVRQDKIRYRPSEDLFADTPATLAAGAPPDECRDTLRVYLRARAQYRHRLERIGDIRFSPNSSPRASLIQPTTVHAWVWTARHRPNTAYTDPSQCAPAGLTSEQAFCPACSAIDLTRGGSYFDFRDTPTSSRRRSSARTASELGDFKLDLGLRYR